jgi:hydroxymethyl cephem carbamoyltransferase
MLIVALKPGRDGAVAVVQDRELLFSIEAEKNSFVRYSPLTPTTILRVAERIERIPDVVAIGGWHRRDLRDDRAVEAGFTVPQNSGTNGRRSSDIRCDSSRRPTSVRTS